MSIPRYHKKVIFASSLGTAFEWYDFYLYGTLAGILGQHFLSGYNPTADFIVTLMLFAVGFVVRPLARCSLVAWVIWWGASTHFWSPF